MASLSRSHSHVFTGCAYRVHSVNDLEPYCLPGKRVVEIFAFHTRLHALALALSLSIRSMARLCTLYMLVSLFASPQILCTHKMPARFKSEQKSSAIRSANCGDSHWQTDKVRISSAFAWMEWRKKNEMTTQRLLSELETGSIDFSVSWFRMLVDEHIIAFFPLCPHVRYIGFRAPKMSALNHHWYTGK